MNHWADMVWLECEHFYDPKMPCTFLFLFLRTCEHFLLVVLYVCLYEGFFDLEPCGIVELHQSGIQMWCLNTKYLTNSEPQRCNHLLKDQIISDWGSFPNDSPCFAAVPFFDSCFIFIATFMGACLVHEASAYVGSRKG